MPLRVQWECPQCLSLSFCNSEDEPLGGKDIHLCPRLASVKYSSVAHESAALSVEWHERVSSPTCERECLCVRVHAQVHGRAAATAHC